MLLLAYLALATPFAGAQSWVPIPLTNPAALCLDGSPGAYQIKAGVGANISKFVLFFQGGGWAMSPADLLYRSTTQLGSTRRDASAPIGWATEDLLTGSAARNPHFSTWTSVGLRYCDGSSFSSHLDAPLFVGDTPLYLRGHDILAASLDQLLGAAPGGGAPSLAAATEVIVAGGSAGGLSVFLHVDYIAGRVRAVNPGVAVAGVANDGFFIDGASIWGGQHFFTGVFQRVVAMGNVSAPAQANGACMAAKAPADRWQCFLAEYTLPHLATRVFIFNSFQDQYQAMEFLSPNVSTADAPGGVTQWAPFAPCTHAPWRGCSATQYSQWVDWGAQFLPRARAAAAATRVAHGAFLTSCPTHGTCIEGRCTTITLRNGQHPMGALLAWLNDASAAPGKHWTEDAPWPAAWSPAGVAPPNPTCAAPWAPAPLPLPPSPPPLPLLTKLGTGPVIGPSGVPGTQDFCGARDMGLAAAGDTLNLVYSGYSNCTAGQLECGRIGCCQLMFSTLPTPPPGSSAQPSNATRVGAVLPPPGAGYYPLTTDAQMLFDGGRWHMFATVMPMGPPEGARRNIAHLIAAGGAGAMPTSGWAYASTSILPALPAWAPIAVDEPRVYPAAAGGGWIMYLGAQGNNNGNFAWCLGYLTAPSLDGPWAPSEGCIIGSGTRAGYQAEAFVAFRARGVFYVLVNVLGEDGYRGTTWLKNITGDLWAAPAQTGPFSLVAPGFLNRGAPGAWDSGYAYVTALAGGYDLVEGGTLWGAYMGGAGGFPGGGPISIGLFALSL